MDRMRKTVVELMFEQAEHDYLHRFRGRPCDDPKKLAAFTAMNSLREQAAGMRRRREWQAELHLLKLHAELTAPRSETLPQLSALAQAKLAAMDARREAKVLRLLAEKQAQTKALQQRQVQYSAYVSDARSLSAASTWHPTLNPRGVVYG